MEDKEFKRMSRLIDLMISLIIICLVLGVATFIKVLELVM